MCGLAGVFVSVGRRPVDRRLLGRMNDAQVHRGPDGWGMHVGPGIGLAHRRLAIIDVDGGTQPLANEDGRVVVVFNGEIYNFQALAAELAAAGHRFRTRSDTEIIVHAWEEWGPASVERFRGMFAFALWDEDRRTLFMARDRLGKKPLHYACLPDGWMAFGSELKSVTAHPGVPRVLDPLAIEDFFAYGYIPDPRSIFAAVRKLEPAHRLIWRRGEAMRSECYWRPILGRPIKATADEAAEELTARLREATRLRMISDVPLGAFLSGGVDSSLVVATMAGLSSDPVRTFSIGFAEADYDESVHAERVAGRYATLHARRQVGPDDLGRLDHLARIYDEPFGDSSALPTLAVAALAREKVTVALSGDGGDELFAGYRRYRLHAAAERVRALVPAPVRRPLFGLLGGLYPKADWAPRWLRARTTFQELAQDSAGAYFRAVSVVDDRTRRRLFSPALLRDLQGYRAETVLRRHMDAADTDDALLKAQYGDLKTFLAGGVLVKVDRASMACSLEVRSPLLDHDLAEWAFRLAPALRLAGGEGKVVLRRAARPFVDRDLLDRPKQGFSMPLARWFRGPLRGRVKAMASGPLAECGLFDGQAIARLVEAHLAGRHDHGGALWLLLMAEGFLAKEAAMPVPTPCR